MTEFTDLEVWKSGRDLVRHIYEVTRNFPDHELFGLTNQMRRCAVSIPSNIGEGCGRQSDKDSVQFFFISRGSAYELETQAYLAYDLNYISEDQFNMTIVKISECKKLINGFIRYYKSKKSGTQSGTKN